MVEVLVMGMYLPIVVCASYACLLFLARLIIPALRMGSRLDDYIIGISATFALAAHAAENAFYGLIRLNPAFKEWNQNFAAVGAWKFLILVSCGFAIAGLFHAETGRAHLLKVFGAVGALWLVGAVGAWLIV